MDNAELNNIVYQLIVKWFSETPKKLTPTSRFNHRDEHGDHSAFIHMRELLAVSAVASNSYHPNILAIATHMKVRGMRYVQHETDFRYARQMRHINEAIQYIDILNDEDRVVTRVRILAHAYQVVVETLACFINLHPRWRRQAAQLRDEAEERFNIAQSDSESDDEMDTQ